MNKKFVFVLAALVMLGLSSQVMAEQSPSSATGKHSYDNQVFTIGYNSGTSNITHRGVVILDTSNGNITDGTIGAYVSTTTTADNVRVLGVADEDIDAGESGRVCIRGPHAVWFVNTTAPANGTILSASGTENKATVYSTPDGTAGGQLGWVLTNEADNSGDDIFWIWVDPKIHK